LNEFNFYIKTKFLPGFFYQVNSSRGFIENEHFCFSEQSSSQTDELTLADTEVASSLGDLVREAGLQRGHEVVQVSQLQDLPHVRVAVVVERVLQKR
jgi:hypothetical protein